MMPCVEKSYDSFDPVFCSDTNIVNLPYRSWEITDPFGQRVSVDLIQQISSEEAFDVFHHAIEQPVA